jgi:hypothetical protein
MGVSGGPNVVTDGLVLDLDAANAQSYPNYYNLMLNTQTFSSGSYAGQGLNTTGTPAWVNVGTAPDGTSTSFALIPTSGSALHRFYYTFPYVSGSIYTFSCYAKSGSRSQFEASLSFTALGSNWRTAAFSLVGTGSVISSNGNAGVSPTITNVGNGWYRCTFTNLCTNTVSDQLAFGYSNSTYAGDGTTTEIQVWGAQMNLGPTALPYQQITTYTTRWSDLSPTVISGSLTNGSYYNAYPITKKITFDGTDDYVAIPNNSSLVTNNISVNIWCYPKVIGQNKALFSSEPTTGPLNGYGFRQRSDNVWWWVIGYAGSGDAVSSSLSQNTWTNLVGTYNGSTITLYKNGVSQGSGSSNRTINFTNILRLGSLVGGTEYFNGDTAFLQIYNRALSADEVLQNYNATKGRFGL